MDKFFSIPEYHMTILRNTDTMHLASMVLADSMASCIASYTDPTKPPSWETLCSCWRSEEHAAHQYIRKKLGEDDGRFFTFAAAVQTSVTEL